MSSIVRCERQGNVALVTLANPPVNAINEPLLAAFHGVLDALESQVTCAVVHLRSELDVFAAGGDMREMRERMAAPDLSQTMLARIERVQALFARLAGMPQITVCEIAGAALGGGFEMALACDLRVAASEAKIGLPEVTLGLFPAAGGTQRLTALAGPGMSARLILSGEILNGDEAHRLGLVEWAVKRCDLQAHCAKLVEKIASFPAAALGSAKRCIRARADPSVDGFELERQLCAQVVGDAETQQRIAAFLARVRT